MFCGINDPIDKYFIFDALFLFENLKENLYVALAYRMHNLYVLSCSRFVGNQVLIVGNLDRQDQ